MVMDVNLICCGDNFTMYTNSESLYCVPETDIMLYVSYISIFKYYVVRLVLFKSSVEFFVYFSRQLTWLTKSPDYRSGDSSVNSAFKTFGIVCWGWEESSALAWDIQGTRVVVCTVVKFPLTVLWIFNSIPDMSSSRVSLGLALVHIRARFPSPSLWDIFSGTPFYISFGQKDGLLQSFSLHGFWQFYLGWGDRRKKGEKEQKGFFFSWTLHSRDPCSSSFVQRDRFSRGVSGARITVVPSVQLYNQHWTRSRAGREKEKKKETSGFPFTIIQLTERAFLGPLARKIGLSWSFCRTVSWFGAPCTFNSKPGDKGRK